VEAEAVDLQTHRKLIMIRKISKRFVVCREAGDKLFYVDSLKGAKSSLGIDLVGSRWLEKSDE
jgi:hypothetical protein